MVIWLIVWEELKIKFLSTTVFRSFSLHEVRRTCRTSPAKMKNVRRRTPVKFNQMSSEEVKMSGEAQKNFVYTGLFVIISQTHLHDGPVGFIKRLGHSHYYCFSCRGLLTWWNYAPQGKKRLLLLLSPPESNCKFLFVYFFSSDRALNTLNVLVALMSLTQVRAEENLPL